MIRYRWGCFFNEKCLVVYNPNSGKYNKEVTLPKIEKILNEYDYSVINRKD